MFKTNWFFFACLWFLFTVSGLGPASALVGSTLKPPAMVGEDNVSAVACRGRNCPRRRFYPRARPLVIQRRIVRRRVVPRGAMRRRQVTRQRRVRRLPRRHAKRTVRSPAVARRRSIARLKRLQQARRRAAKRRKLPQSMRAATARKNAARKRIAAKQRKRQLNANTPNRSAAGKARSKQSGSGMEAYCRQTYGSCSRLLGDDANAQCGPYLCGGASKSLANGVSGSDTRTGRLSPPRPVLVSPAATPRLPKLVEPPAHIRKESDSAAIAEAIEPRGNIPVAQGKMALSGEDHENLFVPRPQPARPKLSNERTQPETQKKLNKIPLARLDEGPAYDVEFKRARESMQEEAQNAIKGVAKAMASARPDNSTKQALRGWFKLEKWQKIGREIVIGGYKVYSSEGWADKVSTAWGSTIKSINELVVRPALDNTTKAMVAGAAATDYLAGTELTEPAVEFHSRALSINEEGLRKSIDNVTRMMREIDDAIN